MALRTRVDLTAIVDNAQLISDSLQPGTELVAVVKADAYGHGAREVARALADSGIAAFGVATVAEALDLRAGGIDSAMLAWLWHPKEDIVPALRAGVELAVSSPAHARAVVAAGLPATVSIKVETGMHRNGTDEVEEICAILAGTEVQVSGIMSHFACADDPEHPLNDDQEQAFERALARVRAAGFECPTNHLANTAAALSRPSSHFQRVRVGLGLYGLNPFSDGRVAPSHPAQLLAAQLRPAMSWEATVVNVHPISAGQSSGYGHSWTAAQDGYVAVVSVGYADGFARSWQGAARLSIAGWPYEQVGRVSMDQVVIDLGRNPHHVAAGDTAVIFGAGGLSATELAAATGTINYEIICRPGGRTERTFAPVASAPVTSAPTASAPTASAPAASAKLPALGKDVEPGTSGTVRLETVAQTQAFAARLGAQLRAGDVVILSGPLGAGKTTFTQGLAHGLGVTGRVTSPTFTIAREHPPRDSGPALIHVDAYRLLDGDAAGDLDSLDLDTALADAVVVAEWGEGIAEALADEYLLISLDRSVEPTPPARDAAAEAPEEPEAPGAPESPAEPESWWSEDEPRTVSWQWVRRQQ